MLCKTLNNFGVRCVKASDIHLCLGIDPNPQGESTFAQFEQCVKRHIEFLNSCESLLSDKILKFQLAYFLAYGSRGIALLEQMVDQFRERYSIVIDGKFNDISTSLKAYLNFVFHTLGAHGITINPFLGTQTLELTLEMCAHKVGAKGRVFVLCATSEGGSGSLGHLQENWQQNLKACVQVRENVIAHEPALQKILGVVVGANREKILMSPELAQSGLSVLAPGLGAQGHDWQIVSKCCTQPNEFIFPVSRGIFAGGGISSADMKKNLQGVQTHFALK